MQVNRSQVAIGALLVAGVSLGTALWIATRSVSQRNRAAKEFCGQATNTFLRLSRDLANPSQRDVVLDQLSGGKTSLLHATARFCAPNIAPTIDGIERLDTCIDLRDDSCVKRLLDEVNAAID